MASRKRLSSKMADSLERLANHRQAFVEGISIQGYSRKTIIIYEWTARHFCDEIKQRGLHIDNLDTPVVEAISEAVIEKASKSTRSLVKFRLGQFIEHLVDDGAIIPVEPREKELTELECLCEEYKAYLRYQRGLSEATIQMCVSYVGRFMTFRFGRRSAISTPSPRKILSPSFVNSRVIPNLTGKGLSLLVCQIFSISFFGAAGRNGICPKAFRRLSKNARTYRAI